MLLLHVDDVLVERMHLCGETETAGHLASFVKSHVVYLEFWSNGKFALPYSDLG